jgi:DNA-directed RNA polymerase specialized sigma24 family protein
VTQTFHDAGHLTPEALCAVIDGELAVWSHRTIQQNLRYCHSCTARSLSATGLKRAIRQVEARFNPYAFDSPDRDRIPENDPVRSDNQATVIAVLRQIRAPFRQPLLLCDVNAVKYNDIAAILDVSIEIVMSRISIALDAVIQILQLQFGELQ